MAATKPRQFKVTATDKSNRAKGNVCETSSRAEKTLPVISAARPEARRMEEIHEQ